MVGGVVVVAAAAVGITLAVTGGDDPEPEPAAAEPTEEPDEELSAQELAARYGPAVWRVEAEGCGGLSTGTAFAIDEHTLVTNWHVTVTDATPQLVSRDGSRTIQGRVLGWSEYPDIAVIEVAEELDVTIDFIGADDLSEGQGIVALGYPVPATDFTVTPATILSFQVEAGRREAIRADGAIDKGNSGGPALTTAGRVAGVVTEMATSEGFQLVPLVYTHDHLVDTIDAIVSERPGVEVDCGSAGARSDLPDGWDEWDDYEGEGPFTYGEDPDLDALWDACDAGDMDACDELYLTSAIGSEYESFGASCGDRDPLWGSCDQYRSSASTSSGERYGDDPRLDVLWDGCATQDWQDCDELYWGSPYGSRYEEFGSTCGDLIDPTYGGCVTAAESEPFGPGDDPSLDILWDACGAGDWIACDDLYWTSPVGSRYEDYGSTCGDRQDLTYGGCEAERG